MLYQFIIHSLLISRTFVIVIDKIDYTIMNSLFFSLFISRTFVIVIVIDRIYHTIIDSIPLIIFIYLFSRTFVM